MEGHVLVDKIPVDPVIADDLVTNGIGYSQVGLGLEQDGFVRRLTGPGCTGGKINDRHIVSAFALCQHTGKKDRMHFCHIVTPGDEHIGVINILVTAHGLIHTK